MPRSRASLQMASTNASEDMLNAVPVHVLESFLPGFSILTRVLEASFGINVTSFVSFCFIVGAIAGAFSFLGASISRQFRAWFTATVIISSTDKLYEQIMYWQSKQDIARSSRNLTAKTNKRVNDTLDDQSQNKASAKSAGGTGEYNFSEIDSRTPPVYAPAYGRHYFRHNGRYFIFNREKVRQTGDIQLFRSSQGMDERESIYISCLGRSTEPVKRLLMECKALDGLSKRSTTAIRRANPQAGGNWSPAITRPSRPLNTVYMDESLKQSLIEDIREFLHPAAPRFYARRGIPYRRGYLFHGPPGTGKTSLSFALAGTFGFELHVFSLQEPYMTDQTISRLFSNLPSRCIVLLEDVDTAGLEERQTDSDKDKDITKTLNAKTDDSTSAEKKAAAEKEREAQEEATAAAIAAQRAQRRAGRMHPAGFMPGMPGQESVTLSGLLNAIDGVASQEGRILIMTTNDPETLDQALIRPGRVDMQIYFGAASKADARKIFVNMFSFEDETDADSTADFTNTSTDDAVVKKLNGSTIKSNDQDALSSSALAAAVRAEQTSANKARRHEIEQVADAFTAIIPDSTFTPAEIQGFLLMRRKSPTTALKDAPAWSKALLDAKKAGSNVVSQSSGGGDTTADATEKGGDAENK